MTTYTHTTTLSSLSDSATIEDLKVYAVRLQGALTIDDRVKRLSVEVVGETVRESITVEDGYDAAEVLSEISERVWQS